MTRPQAAHMWMRELRVQRTGKVKLPEAKLERRLETNKGTAEGVGDEDFAEEGEKATAEKVGGTGVAAQSRRGVGPRSLGLTPIAQWFDWTDT